MTTEIFGFVAVTVMLLAYAHSADGTRGARRCAARNHLAAGLPARPFTGDEIFERLVV
jgi:hypothetical protein